MKQLSPLHIGILFFFVILFIFFKIGVLREEITTQKEELHTNKKLAVELAGLKQTYADKKKNLAKLKRLLAQKRLKSANLQTSQSKKAFIIESKSVDIELLNALFSKLLNDSYRIESLELKRIDDTNAALKVEVAL